MEDKTFAGFIIMGIIIAGLLLIILFQIESWEKMNAEIEAKAYELKINQSWDDGWYNGYEWGASDIFEETMRNGVYVHPSNETWVIYSPEGCAAVFAVELENMGCEIVCAGP